MGGQSEDEQHEFCSVEAEAALLGVLLGNGGANVADRVQDILPASDFFEPLHGRIYSAAMALFSQGKVANPVTLRPYFERDPDMQELGGPAYLAQLTGSAGIIGVYDFAEQIKELAQRRRYVERLREAMSAAADMNITPEELAAAAEEAVVAVRDESAANDEYTGAACLDLVIDGFGKPIRGVTCGTIPSLDHVLGPLPATDLIIGAGRPGMGKTLTVQSYMLGAAAKGHGVAFFSLEMGGEALGERMAAELCLDSRIPHKAIRDRNLTAAQQMEVCRARERIAELPIVIVQKGGLTLRSLRTRIKRIKRRMAAKGQSLDLVIVDYLQLLRPDRANLSPYEAVSEISRTLKEIAMDEGVALFALSQLSRKVEDRADKRPHLSDLRDSGSIEQDADTIVFFLREEYYLRLEGEPRDDDKAARWRAAMEACQGSIEFICAKRRHGEAGSATGQFLGAFQTVR